MATSLVRKRILFTAKYSTNQWFIYVQNDHFINFQYSNVVEVGLVFLEKRSLQFLFVEIKRTSLSTWSLFSVSEDLHWFSCNNNKAVERTSDFLFCFFLAKFEVGSWVSWFVEWQTLLLPLKIIWIFLEKLNRWKKNHIGTKSCAGKVEMESLEREITATEKGLVALAVCRNYYSVIW